MDTHYQVELVLMLYSIIIAFSFNIFQVFPLLSFQGCAGLATLLFLIGRLLSIKAKFLDMQGHPYDEMFFFIDIAIMVALSRFIAILQSSYHAKEQQEKATYTVWVWFATIMLLAFFYRALYGGLSISSLSQAMAVCYGLGGYALTHFLQRGRVPREEQQRLLLVYSFPLLLGAIVYCIIRFRFQEF